MRIPPWLGTCRTTGFACSTIPAAGPPGTTSEPMARTWNHGGNLCRRDVPPVTCVWRKCFHRSLPDAATGLARARDSGHRSGGTASRQTVQRPGEHSATPTPSAYRAGPHRSRRGLQARSARVPGWTSRPSVSAAIRSRSRPSVAVAEAWRLLPRLRRSTRHSPSESRACPYGSNRL